MKYCTKCKSLDEKDALACPQCGTRPMRAVQAEDPVFLVSASGFERERITAALGDAGIPVVEEMEKREAASAVVMGELSCGMRLFVPYRMLSSAQDVLIGIGASQPEGEEAKIVEEEVPPQEEPAPPMSRGKRFVVRAVSVVLFIAIVWAVVAGVDWVMGLIRGL
jgi:hypothetical protein